MCLRAGSSGRGNICEKSLNQEEKTLERGLHEDRGIHLVHSQAPSTTTPATNKALYKHLAPRMNE